MNRIYVSKDGSSRDTSSTVMTGMETAIREESSFALEDRVSSATGIAESFSSQLRSMIESQ